jgi:hypothetical protein
MINDVNDFCLCMYVVVDEIWLKIAPFFKRSGPSPNCPDSELLAMALIGECRGWDMETEMLSQWQEHPHPKSFQSPSSRISVSIQSNPSGGSTKSGYGCGSPVRD